MVPGGLRIGTPALTSRGFTEKDFETVADFIVRGIKIAQDVKKASAGTKLVDFKKALDSKEWPELTALTKDVENFATQFPTIGFEKASGKYTQSL
jgi:glycine hydroxymethyltransferase